MKNHIKVNGQLLQTNKKWSALSQKQQNWIYETVRTEYETYVAEHNRLPVSHNKQELFNKIYTAIEEREIWIPYGEFKSHINKFIDRLNLKSELYKPKLK